MKLENFQNLPKWLKSNVFFRARLEYNSGEEVDYKKEHKEVHPLDANLISSRKPNGRHTLILDLDLNHFHVKSSTPGHGHLYVDTDLKHDALKEIIDVLAKHGVVQPGIKKQLDQRGFLTLRPPGVKKNDPLDDADFDTAKQMLSKSDGVGDDPATTQLSHEFKELKHQLVQTYTSKDVYNMYQAKMQQEYQVACTTEVYNDLINKFVLALGLDQDTLEEDSKGQLCLKHKHGKRTIAFVEIDLFKDIYILTFSEKHFPYGLDGWPDWEEVRQVIKVIF